MQPCLCCETITNNDKAVKNLIKMDANQKINNDSSGAAPNYLFVLMALTYIRKWD